MNNKTLYSIGYANKSLATFLKCLVDNNINCIIDVRSSPYSKQYPNFNKENLANFLKENNILYMNFNREFGARRIEDNVYSKVRTYDNKTIEVVIFEKVWETIDFQKGFNRVVEGIEKGFNICFMCSEKYPYECHRGLMVSEYFYKRGYDIMHIVDENLVLPHSIIEERLNEYFNSEYKIFEKMYLNKIMYGGDLFSLSTGTIDKNFDYWNQFFNSINKEKVYYLQNLKIGYKKGTEYDE